MSNINLQFSITPFYITRQFYYALEQGIVEPDGIDLEIEYNHSPIKDQVLICGKVDATTMSMGKYILAKTISDTYTLPTDPFAVATSLTYERGNGLFVHEDSDIKDPQDLEGKRLGIHDKSMVLTYHKAILEELYDVDVDSIEWVFDTHQGLTGRMADRNIDCVERVGDWYWNLATSPDHNMLYDMGDKWEHFKGYYPIVHVVPVDKDLYDDQPDKIGSFVEALQASGQYREENYDAIIEAFANEADSETEWTGSRDIEQLKQITGKALSPFTLEEPQRKNFRDWMEYAVKYDVLSEPISEERLYPL